MSAPVPTGVPPLAVHNACEEEPNPPHAVQHACSLPSRLPFPQACRPWQHTALVKSQIHHMLADMLPVCHLGPRSHRRAAPGSTQRL
eukprot:23185-Chlamydomonas_euryale.AAC.4